jgi:hypothetical protein
MTPTGQWFYPGPPVSSTNKTDITEILLKVVLNTIKQTNKHIKWTLSSIIIGVVHGNNSLIFY